MLSHAPALRLFVRLLVDLMASSLVRLLAHLSTRSSAQSIDHAAARPLSRCPLVTHQSSHPHSTHPLVRSSRTSYVAPFRAGHRPPAFPPVFSKLLMQTCRCRCGLSVRVYTHLNLSSRSCIFDHRECLRVCTLTQILDSVLSSPIMCSICACARSWQ